jgi:hypothetical protein
MTHAGLSRLKSWAAGAFFLLALGAFGLFFGVLVATRILTTSGMGWDQLADFFGGAILGAGAAFVLGLVVVRRLAPLARTQSAILAVLGTGGAMAYMSVTPPNVRPPSAAALPEPPVQSFVLTLGTADPLTGARQEDPSLPWDLLRIASNLTVDYVMHDEPDLLCVAVDALRSDAGITAAQDLRSVLEALPAEIACEPPCATCTQISLGWYLDGRSASLAFDDRCWRTNDALQPVRASVAQIVAQHGQGAMTCERMPGQ